MVRHRWLNAAGIILLIQRNVSGPRANWPSVFDRRHFRGLARQRYLIDAIRSPIFFFLFFFFPTTHFLSRCLPFDEKNENRGEKMQK